ncbi:hypothetical protein M436DRAFT_78758 [Aureobasidium namibiae CBS 147.97]|uniref:Uncharacterized protein n=1 Tax=Aureobasidium namibiae CBS 147.97 TaxID=1043004 RepID=A0A074WUZ2_9PEZI
MLPKDVHVRLHYLNGQRNGEKETGKPSKTKLSCAVNALSVLETIHDVRGAHEEFNLDLQGFRFVRAPTKFEGWASKQEITKVYVPEIENLLRQEVDGCDEIHVVSIEGLDHCCNQPVHVDYTASSVESLLHETDETKANYLLTGRVRLINIWRPIKGVMSRSSIAIADGRGVDSLKDISKVDTGTPVRHVRYRDGYHWYYMSEQAEKDVVLFKTYDSDKSQPSSTCLRATFDIPNTATDMLSETIEIRALIFTHPVSKQVAHDQQSEEEVEMLKRKITSLSDEISESQALIRAGLNLRQWESSKTAEQMRHLISDRDHARTESLSLSMQLNYLEDWITNLYMLWGPSCHYDPLVERLQHLISSTPRLYQRLGQTRQAHASLVQNMGMYGPDVEILLLRRQLQAQHTENKRLKARIKAQVEDGMDEVFDSTLQTTVEYERGRDDSVIEGLRWEMQRLHEALEAKTSEKEKSAEAA